MESLKLSEFGVFQTVVKGAEVEKEGRQELDHLDSFKGHGHSLDFILCAMEANEGFRAG